jgi:hypothetical protein
MKNIFLSTLLFLGLSTAYGQSLGRITALGDRGQMVQLPFVVQPGLTQDALAQGGVLMVSPRLLQASYAFQRFVMAREASRALGSPSERQADILAVRALRQEGFSSRDLVAVFEDLQRDGVEEGRISLLKSLIAAR